MALTSDRGLLVWSIARPLGQALVVWNPAEKLGISHGRSSKDGTTFIACYGTILSRPLRSQRDGNASMTSLRVAPVKAVPIAALRAVQVPAVGISCATSTRASACSHPARATPRGHRCPRAVLTRLPVAAGGQRQIDRKVLAARCRLDVVAFRATGNRAHASPPTSRGQGARVSAATTGTNA